MRPKSLLELILLIIIPQQTYLQLAPIFNFISFNQLNLQSYYPQQMDTTSNLKDQTNTNLQNSSIQTQQSRLVVLEDEGIVRKVGKMIDKVKAYVSSHKSEIYLVVTLLTILFTFYSFNYYREALICKLQDDNECLKILMLQVNKIMKFVILVLIDCFVLIFYLYSFIFKKTYRILIAIGIIQHILLFYTGQFEMSVFDITGIVKAGHYLVFFISLALFFIAVTLKFCLKKNAKYTLAGLVLLCLAFYLVVLRNQCYYWKLGINGEIQDQEGSCKMDIPMCAQLHAIAYLDLNFFFQNCFLGEKYKKVFDKHFSYGLENGTIVGFSDLKNASELQRSHNQIPFTVFKYAKRYKTMEEVKKTKQHDVIFDTVQQRYHIDVLYNQTLAEEKAEIHSKYESSASPPLAKNVLIIFLDAVSRFQTHLKLPKLVGWFEKQAKHKSYSLNEPSSPHISQAKAQAYEFYKYHALGYFTVHSIFPMFYGHSLDQFQDKQGYLPVRFESLHKSFSERGFITSFSSSFCGPYGADMYDFNLRFVINPIADHQSFSFNCDPNFHQPYIELGFTKGNSASTDRCLYHKSQAEYAFQYTFDFFDKYKNSSKMSHINLIEGHDFVGGSVKYIDSAISSFLQELQAKGHLKDTLVIALSDHGQHQGGSFQSILSDHFNPFLFMAVPQEMNKQYRDSIRLNQQNLVTAYNVYHFLMHVAIGSSYGNKTLGLMGSLSFQTSCQIANIFPPQGADKVCYCQ